jgi:hypothetical protein
MRSNARVLSAVIATAALIAGLVGPSVADQYDAEGYKRPQRGNYGLVHCQTPTALDCVESVTAITKDGIRIVGNAATAWWGNDPALGLPLNYFNVPGTKNHFGEQAMFNHMVYPGGIAIGAQPGDGHTALYGEIEAVGVMPPNPIQVPISQPDRALVACPDGRVLCLAAYHDTSMTWEVVIRLDWLVPTYLGVPYGDFTASAEKLPGGGHRVTVTGSQGLFQVGIPVDEPLTKAQDTMIGYGQSWVFGLVDGRDVFGTARCLDKGFMFARGNGFGQSRPGWDAKASAMTVQLSGFHYEPDGQEARGVFEIDIPGEMVRCLWNIDPKQTNQVKISMTNEGGETKSATTTIKYEDGQVKFRAYNFTYSNPQVRISVVKPKTPAKVTVKKSTITCVKGKTIKKVTAVAPRCPKGYSKR